MLEKLYEAMDQGYEITIEIEAGNFISHTKMFVDELCPYENTIEIWGGDDCVIVEAEGWRFYSEEVDYYGCEKDGVKCKIIF